MSKNKKAVAPSMDDLLRKPTPKKEREIIGNNLASILESKQMTQAELADLSGLDQNHVCRIINGHKKQLSLSTAIKISNALRMQVEEIFEIQES